MPTSLTPGRLQATEMRPPRLWLTTGEPAGIGPELALDFARSPVAAEMVLVGDPDLLLDRATRLQHPVDIRIWHGDVPATPLPGCVWVRPVRLRVPSVPGSPDTRNADYVLETLRVAAKACRDGEADAIVTAPVHKGIIAEAQGDDGQRPFSGHTEFLADLTGGKPVMMLVAGQLRVALATTHLPLRAVPDALNRADLKDIIEILDRDLYARFGISRPRIRVCGLNPHAGEGGHLGREEIDVITPAIDGARLGGIDVSGPFPADTLLTPERWREADVVLAMFHDQGLPPLKYAGFGHGINVTLGLPIIRTSVDHGTALDLAGTGRASAGSLRAAAELAIRLVHHQRDALAA